MSERRDFIKTMGAIAAGTLTVPGLTHFALAAEIESHTARIKSLPLNDAVNDEAFWKQIRLGYSVSPSIINLNNGGVSPQPILVQDMLDRYNRMSNEAPSYYMWRVLDMGREPLRERLAQLAGCSPEEIAINRNTTEALDTVIFGLDLNPGDEVIVTKQDYPNMKQAWVQREMRDKIKLVWLDLKCPSEDDNHFVKTFADAITSKTKVVHITHLINWNGQLLPSKKIADAVRSKNKDVFILADVAHSFAHIDFKMPQLGADAAGTSLHKWLCAPFGTGMLYIRRDKISHVWPLFPNDKPQSDDIRKFESQGTRSFPTEQATGYAINFHETIGTPLKHARLHYLKNYWSTQVQSVKGITLHTPLNKTHSGAIGTFSIDGMKASDIESKLMSKYKIHTVAIEYEMFNHVRVTPNVYTSIDDLNKLVKAISEIASSK
jgi:selenocysteine lyase/cysteine desulfurase